MNKKETKELYQITTEQFRSFSVMENCGKYFSTKYWGSTAYVIGGSHPVSWEKFGFYEMEVLK